MADAAPLTKGSDRGVGRTILPLALVVAIAVVVRVVLGTDTDVSWLITVSEKMLAGERLYRDVLETNPPAAVFIYWVPVALAKPIGLRPETAVDLFCFLWAGAALWGAGLVLRGSERLADLDRRVLLVAAAGIFLILPMVNFAQREHFAAMAATPMLAIYARRAAGEPVALRAVLLAAFGAAIAVGIKPPLALPLGFGALAAAWCGRDWRAFVGPENMAGAVLFAAYLATTYLAYPAFFSDIAPALAEVYAPHRVEWALLVGQPPPVLWAVLLAMTLALLPWRPSVAVLAAASVGGAIAYLVQGKGWSYQAYPMVAFGLLAFAALAAGRVRTAGGSLGARGILMASSVLLVVLGQLGWNAMSGRLVEIAPEVRGLAPHAKMLLIGNNIGMGHPLVRLVDGRWVGSLPSLWASAGARKLAAAPGVQPEQALRYAAYQQHERDVLVRDIERHRPDLILIGTDRIDWGAWAAEDVRLKDLLATYAPVLTVRGGVLLRRRAAG